MKKVLASILAVFYLSTSMGATVHFHYCMGRLVSWGLTENSGKTCDFCGMQKMGSPGECMVGMKNCCHEESKQIRSNKDQKAAQESYFITKVTSAGAYLPARVWENEIILSTVLSQPLPHGPPLVTSLPAFLRNCNFRI